MIDSKNRAKPIFDAASIYCRYTSLLTCPCSLCSLVVGSAADFADGRPTIIDRPRASSDPDFERASFSLPFSVESSEDLVSSVSSSSGGVAASIGLFGVDVPELPDEAPCDLLRNKLEPEDDYCSRASNSHPSTDVALRVANEIYVVARLQDDTATNENQIVMLFEVCDAIGDQNACLGSEEAVRSNHSV